MTRSDANPVSSINRSTMTLMGIISMYAIKIPISPAVNPMSNVSALNILDMSFLRAPKLLIIPISFVLSTTDT